eukprot:36905-Eustigmatos_ZCMA.PRE.1
MAASACAAVPHSDRLVFDPMQAAMVGLTSMTSPFLSGSTSSRRAFCGSLSASRASNRVLSSLTHSLCMISSHVYTSFCGWRCGRLSTTTC